MGINWKNTDVKENLGVAEAERVLPSMIVTKPWDARLAFERLNVVRDVEDKLKNGINEHSIEIPDAIANEYEKVYAQLRTIEQMEIATIKWGR